MLIQKYLAVLGISLSCLLGEARAQGYPEDYFRNPLDIPILLAGNFGECRPGHFHSGIDIKTNGQENLAVHAAADGYISRIKMEPGGFGHALYITHPNGYTTLYAHLNKFMPAIQKYIRSEQYKKKNWQVDIALTPSQFPVKKGQQIAWSGNTGASTAPHLHFEIRNTKTEHPLNPMLFGLEIHDSIAPKPAEVAVYDMNKGIYEQSPRMMRLRKTAAGIYTGDTVWIKSTHAGVGVDVNDYMNGSSNTLNYYTAKLMLDGALVLNIRLDDIGYDVTRYMHAFVDYKTKKLSNKWIQCLFQLEGNRLNNIYEYAGGNKALRGVLPIEEGTTKHIEIILTDAMGNESDISFHLACKNAEEIKNNCDEGTWFRTGQANSFTNEQISFTLDDKALYEPMCFEYKKLADANGAERYMISHAYVPVHTWFDLKIKPNDPEAFNTDRDKVAFVYYDGKEESGTGAQYENGWYVARVCDLGEYRLVTDKTPPAITPSQKQGALLSKAQRINFVVKDEITSVKKFSGELDGKWICFERHGNNYFYEFDEHCPKGKHTIEFTAADENNNSKTLRYTFTR